MAYEITLTRAEYDSLAWCAARYESARILYEGLECPDGDEGNVMRCIVPEHVAWNARDAIAEDGGDAYEDGGFIPCLDSPSIAALFDRIV